MGKFQHVLHLKKKKVIFFFFINHNQMLHFVHLCYYREVCIYLTGNLGHTIALSYCCYKFYKFLLCSTLSHALLSSFLPYNTFVQEPSTLSGSCALYWVNNSIKRNSLEIHCLFPADISVLVQNVMNDQKISNSVQKLLDLQPNK